LKVDHEATVSFQAIFTLAFIYEIVFSIHSFRVAYGIELSKATAVSLSPFTQSISV